MIDALSLYEAGARNIVSVPSGCSNLDWIDHCWNWLERFQTIILFGDNDAPGRKMISEVVRRLDESRCMIVEDYPDRPDGSPCKDANEILFFHGAQTLLDTLSGAQAVPVKGLLQLADVMPYDPTTVPRIKTMIPALDETIGGLAEGAITVFTGRAGSGKLLSDSTPVLTRDGWKMHGQLVIGDEVIGLDGQYKKVTHVFPKDYADIKITFSNGEEILCHENHEWVVEYHSGNTFKQRIAPTHEILQAFEDGRGYGVRKGSRSYRYKLPCASPVQGTEKVLPVAPYTLGAWLGDGRTTNPDICTAPCDYAIVERIFKDGYEMAWQTTHKTTGCFYTSFRDLRNGLQKLGMCHSRKRLTKHIPEEYLTASYSQRLELLAGLIDTDGHFDRTKGYYGFSTTEPRLKDDIISLLSTFGWRCSV